MLMIWLLKTNFCMNFRPILNRCSLMTVDKKKVLRESILLSLALFHQNHPSYSFGKNDTMLMCNFSCDQYSAFIVLAYGCHMFFYETLECRKYLRLNSSAIWRKRGILMTLNRNPKTCRSNKEHWVKLNNLVWRRHPGQRYQTLW